MELEFIDWLRERLPPHRLLRLGIGDDAAVLDLAGSPQCAITVDTLTDGVDFVLAQVDPRIVGRKALAANLSDLAAMAARPLAAVVSLVLPKENAFSIAQGLYEGMIPLAEKYDLALAGGDTNAWDGPLAVTVTLLGAVGPRGPLRRGGARPGDKILVTGSLGGSILQRHFTFEPRVAEAMTLSERYDLHAGMDISDGLSLDLSRLAKESGCGAVVDLSAVPISEDAETLARRSPDGPSALEHALGDGEDFELILAVAPQEAERMMAERPIETPLTVIGEFVADKGLWTKGENDSLRPLEPRGWRHG